MARNNLIQFRKGTLSQFNSTNPTLASGEPGFAIDANVLKVGDGITPWSGLLGFSVGSGISNINGLTSSSLVIDGGRNIQVTTSGTEIINISYTGLDHISVSAISNETNSNNTFIQDLLFDQYGHVTGVASVAVTGIGDSVPSNVLVSGDNISLLTNDADYESIPQYALTASPGNANYTFNGPGLSGGGNDPTLYLYRGRTYKFVNNMGAHPFQFQTTAGVGGTAYTDGITGSPVSNGTLTWEIQHDAPNILYYQCTSHSSMQGVVYILDKDSHPTISTISSVDNSNNTFVQDLSFDQYGHVTGVVSIGVTGIATTEDLSSVSGYLQGQINALPSDTNTFVSGIVYSTGSRDLVLTRNDGVLLTGDLSVVLQSGDNISLLNNNLGYITGFTETISSGDPVSFLVNDVPYAISGTHIAISNAASNVNNTDDDFVQDLLFDEFGHITGVVSAKASSGVVNAALNTQVQAGEHILLIYDSGTGTDPTGTLTINVTGIIDGGATVNHLPVFSNTVTPLVNSIIHQSGNTLGINDIASGGNITLHAHGINNTGSWIVNENAQGNSIYNTVFETRESGTRLGAMYSYGTAYGGGSLASVGSGGTAFASITGPVAIGPADATKDLLFGAGNAQYAKMTSTEFRINHDGLNRDFRVEGVTDQDLIVADASTGRVGIGTGVPEVRLHVSATNGEGTILSQTHDNNSWAGLLVRNEHNQNVASFQYGNSGVSHTPSLQNTLIVGSRQSGVPVKFYQGAELDGAFRHNNERIIFDTSGNTTLTAASGQNVVVSGSNDFIVYGIGTHPLIYTDPDSGPGRVGIGRIPDNYVLDVSGSLRVSPISTATRIFTVNNTSGTTAFEVEPNSVYTRLPLGVNITGSVNTAYGIEVYDTGIMSTGTFFFAAGNGIDAVGAYVKNINPSGDSFYALGIDGGAVNWVLMNDASGRGTEDTFVLMKGNVASDDVKLAVTASGNVGIGTDSPSTKLEVANNGNTTIRANNTSDNIINILNVDSDKGYIGTITDHDLRIGTNSNGRIIISNTGNVGIGVDPDVFLSGMPSHHPSFVLGDGNGHTSQTIYSASTSAGVIYFADGVDETSRSRGWISYDHNSGLDRMRFATSNVARMFIDSVGSVGIGTDSPVTKLDVSGTITASSGNSTQWNTAYGWGDHSQAAYITGHPVISAANTSSNAGNVFIQNLTLDANGHILAIDVALPTGVGGGGSGISSLLEDQNPQLGGNLDLNNKNIDGAGSIDIDGPITAEELTISSSDPYIYQRSTDSTEIVKTYHYDTGSQLGGLLSYGKSSSAFTSFNTLLGLGAGSFHLFSSYGHLGINTYGVAKDIVFGTDNTERARITSVGDIGIGTNSPVSKLDIRDGDILVGTKLVVGSGVYSQTSPGAYFGLKHTSLTGPSEYMIMSAGTHTYLSAKEDSDVIIRGGGNKVDHQVVVSESGVTIGKYRPAASSVVAEHDVELVYDDGGCVRVADRGGSGVMIGDCAYSLGDTYAGMKHTHHSGSQDYMMISQGYSTLVSSKSGYSTYLRAGGNATTYQTIIGSDAWGIGPNANRLRVNSQSVLVNNGTGNYDFKVYGQNNATPLIHADAALSRVGIGTATPASTLDVDGTITATTLVKSGGTSSQFLKADGSVDTSTYLTGSSTIGSLTDVTLTTPINNDQVLSYSSVGGFTNTDLGLNLMKRGSIPFGGYSDSQMGHYFFFDGSSEAVINTDGDDINFRVEGSGGTNLLFTDAGTDRVGIGNNSPTHKLDVAGETRIMPRSSPSGHTLYLGRHPYQANIKAEGSNQENQWMIIDSAGSGMRTALNYFVDDDVLLAYGGGNVGVGTTSPNNQLDIYATGVHAGATIRGTNAPGLKLWDMSYGTYNNGGSKIVEQASSLHSGVLIIDADTDNVGHGSYMSLRVDGTERVQITEHGNLGIGVDPDLFIRDLPSHHPSLVLGDGNGHTSQTFYSSSSSSAVIYFADGTGISHYPGYIQYTHSEDHMQFATNNLVRMRIDSAGNVGIGTPSPAHKLDVVYPDSGCVRFADPSGSGIMIGDCALSSNATYAGMQHTKMVGSYMMVSDGDDTYISARDTQSVFIRGGGNAAEAEIAIHDVGAGGVGIVFNSQSADRDIRIAGTGDANLFRVDADEDRIGIGTATPAYKLHVQGTAYIYNGIISPTTAFRTADIPLSGPPIYDGFIAYQNSDCWGLGNSANDGFVFEKTDGNQGGADGGIFFNIRGSGGTTETAMSINGQKEIFIGQTGTYVQQGYSLNVKGGATLDSLNINSQYTLPTADGTAGQSLVTDGAGNIVFSSISGGGAGGSGNLVRGSEVVTATTGLFDVSGGYSVGTLDVYQNGVKLFEGAAYDYTATNGTSFTLANSANSGDLIEYIGLNTSTNAVGNTSLGTVTVTSNQTVFNTSDTFTSSNLAVFLNGVKLVDGTDYNVTSSSQFTLTSTAVSGDIVEYIAYGATVASSNLQKTGDTMTGNLTVNADLIVKGYKETHTDNGNTGTSQTIDISSSTLQTYTLTGNCTFTMPTAEAGRSFTMFLKTGAGSFSATFTGVKFPLNIAPIITTDANRMDLITFYSDGTNWYGNTQQEYHI
jgi:hypothetical protein